MFNLPIEFGKGVGHFIGQGYHHVDFIRGLAVNVPVCENQ